MIITLTVLKITFGLIILLLLIEIGFTKWLHEEIYTNPKTTKIMRIIGGVSYMVGGSLLAAVMYEHLSKDSVDYTAFLIAIAFTVYGEILKESK